MKLRKLLCVLCALTLLLALCACEKRENARTELAKPTEDATAAPKKDDDAADSDAAHDIAPDEEQKNETDVSALPGYGFAVSDAAVASMVSFVSVYDNAPQEFTDVGELRDETLVFAAAAAKSPLFSQTQDGMSATLPLSELKDGVRFVFGDAAALSGGFMSKDYSPYSIDEANDMIIRGSYGGLSCYWFPWAVTGSDGEYKLYLLDLADPLFFDNEQNQELLFTGGEVTRELVNDLAPSMQCAVYTLKQAGGRFTLAGFGYLNYKAVDHFIF